MFSVIKKAGYVLTAALVLFSVPVFAQSVDWESEATRKTIDGISNIASSIISDSFTPMTHFKKGEWTVSVVPAYARVKQAYDDPEVKGEGMNVFSGGFGGGYAVNDSLMVYGIMSFMKADGKLKGKIYGDQFGEQKFDTDYSLVNFNTGIGYDLLAFSDSWSVPVYAGVSLQRFGVDVKPPTVSGSGYSMQSDISGSGVIFGLNAGIAASKLILDTYRITPYFLWMRGLNRPELEGDVKITNPLSYDTSSKEKFKLDPVKAYMLGLNFTVNTGDRWAVSVCTGGLLSSLTGFYHEKANDGLDMISVVIAITYRGGISGSDSE